MNKSKFYLTGAATLVALTAVAGVGFMTYAQTTDNTASAPATEQFGRGFGRGMMGGGRNITDEQRAEFEAGAEERQAAAAADRQAIEDAMAVGYDEWVAAVEESRGENAPILSQITSANFDKFVEAHEHMTAARTIMDELGLEKGLGMGFGKGAGRGAGLHRGMGDCPMAGEVNEN